MKEITETFAQFVIDANVTSYPFFNGEFVISMSAFLEHRSQNLMSRHIEDKVTLIIIEIESDVALFVERIHDFVVDIPLTRRWHIFLQGINNKWKVKLGIEQVFDKRNIFRLIRVLKGHIVGHLVDHDAVFRATRR